MRDAIAIAGLLLLAAAPCTAQEALTLEDVLALARERSTIVSSARGLTEEARGRLTGARVLLRENPVLEGDFGTRSGVTAFDEDVRRFRVSQPFGLGLERNARIAGAEAGVAGAEAREELALRDALREVSAAFHRSVHAGERLALALLADSLSAEVLRIAEERSRVGDAPRLDVNLARVARSRARAETEGALAKREAAVGSLRTLLALPVDAPFEIRGGFAERGHYDLAELLERVPARADVKALEAAVREADADTRLGGALRWPSFAVGAELEREGEEETQTGTAALTLPIFERGQGERKEAQARKQRVQRELDALRVVAATEVRLAFDRYTREARAVEELESEAIPLLKENEALARRSYESGQLGLADFLFLQGELLETRVDYLDRSLEAALAEVELRASAGLLH